MSRGDCVNPWLTRRVIGWAHQGGALEAPPNTIAAMKKAMANGAHALEFDVHQTSDGALVLSHDAHIDAEGRRLEIPAETLSELREAKPDLATLEEALTEFPGVAVTVEVKAKGAADAVAARLAAEVGKRPLIATSFKASAVRAIKKAAPELDTSPAPGTIFLAWLFTRFGLAPPVRRDRHVALQVPPRFDQIAIVKHIPLVRKLPLGDRRFIRLAHKRCLAVHVWTLNTEDQILQAIEADADGIMTDRPSLLARLLGPGVGWPGDP